MILLVTIMLVIILFAEIIIGLFFPNLTFVTGSLTIANRVLGYFAFSGAILFTFILFKTRKGFTIPLGFLLFLIFFINSCSEIFPIDTTTQPKDIMILQTNKDGTKLVLRERINVKTKGIIQDTSLVRDNLIFRQVIKNTYKTTNKK